MKRMVVYKYLTAKLLFLVNVWNFPITENSENVGSSEGGRVGLIPCISGNNYQNVTKFGLNVHRAYNNSVIFKLKNPITQKCHLYVPETLVFS